MSIESWNGGSGGWGTVANWTGGIPNSTTADATITSAGTYTVTVESGKSYTVDSVGLTDGTAVLDVVGTLALGGTEALMNIAAGTLELAGMVSGGTVMINGNATLLALGGVLTGNKAFDLAGGAYINLDNHALTLGGTSNLLGYVIGTGDLVVSGLGTLTDNVYFESGVTLDDTGTIVLDSSTNFANGGTAAALLTIASGGTFDIAVANVQLANNGTFNIVNAGLFEMTGTNASGAYVNVYNSSFTNSSTGTITAVAGSDVSLLAGHEDLNGKIIGAGDLYIGQGATATLEAGLSLNVGILTFSDSSTDIILESNRTIGNEFSALNGATISLNGNTLIAAGTGQLRGYVNGGGTLDVAGSFDVGGVYVASGTELLVTGIANQDQYNLRLDYDNSSLASVLSIGSTGTFDITVVNNDLDYNGTLGTVLNSGLFENVTSLAAYTSASDYSYYNLYGNFTNTSTGTIYVGTADDISLLYGTDDLAGTVTGAGDLFIGQGATATLEASLVLNNGRYLTFDDSFIYLESNRVFGQTLQLQDNANLHLDGYTATLANHGTLGALVTGPGTFDVDGTYFASGLLLGGGVTEAVSGIEIQNGEIRLNYPAGTAATVLTIASTGTYDITADSSIDTSGPATIVDSGLFEKTGFDSYSNIYPNFTETSGGTIAAVAGTDISLLGATNDIAGTLTGGGQVYFGNGSSDTLEASAVIANLANLAMSDSGTQLTLESSRNFAGSFLDQNGAILQLNGQTLSLTGKSQFTSGEVAGGGELIITGTSDFDNLYAVGTMTIVDKGTITQDGFSELGTNNSADVVLSIASGAVYNIIDDIYINPQGTSAIDNAGLFEKTAGGGISDIYAPVINLATGTIDAVQGNLRLDNGGTLNGLLTGAGLLDLQGGTFSLASGATVSVKHLDVTGAELVLEGARSYAGAFELNGGTVDLNGFNLSLNNAGDDLANGYVYGPGTLSEAGRADIDNLYLGGGAVLKDTATMTQDGGLYLGFSAADSAALSISATGIYDIVNDNEINATGSVAINNAGLFEKTAGSGASNIYATFNNAAGATLRVDHGYIQLLNGGSLAGTLTGAAELYLGRGTFGLAAAAVLNVGTLNINGGQLNLLGAHSFTDSFIESSGDFDLNGFNATLAASDHLDNAYLSGPGTLAITGTTELSNYYVAGIGTAIQDAGTIIADGNLFLGNAATDSATLNIVSGGVYNLINDAYIYNEGSSAALNNAGLLEKTSDNGNSLIYATINNTGIIDVARGLLDLVAGGTLAGTLEGAGILQLGAGTFVLQSAAVLGSVQLDLYQAALSVQSNRAYGGVFDQIGNGGDILLNAHTLTLSGNDTLVGYLSGPGTLNITGTTDTNGYNLTKGATLLDAGTITMDGAFQIGTVGTDTGTLSVASTGTFDILNDNYVYETGTVAIVNSGLFEKTGSGTGRSYVQGAFTNASTGTLALTTGILEMQTLTNDGIVNVANALLQTDTNATADAGKTGQINLAGKAVLDEVSGIAASQTIAMSGTGNELYIGNASVFAGTITGFAAGDTIDLANTVANGFNYASNKLTLTENGATVTIISLAGITTPGSISLVQDGGAGTDIEFKSPSTVTQPSGAITTDVFAIPSGTTADFNTPADWSTGTVAGALNLAQFHGAGTITDSGINTVYQIDFNNNGLVFLQNAGTLNVIDGGGIDSGILNQAAGATILDQAGVLSLPIEGTIAGTLAGAGAIEVGGNPGNGQTAVTIAAGAVLTVATLELDNVVLGGNETYAGVFNGPGGDYLGLNGHTLDLTGPALLAPTYEYSVSGPGELILAGTATTALLYLNGGVLLDVSGTTTEDQGLNFNGGGGDTSSMTIALTGTFDLANGGNINGAGNGATSILNNGLLQVVAGNYSQPAINNLNLSQTSTGTIDATRGLMVFSSDTGYLNGTLTGAGEIEFASSNITIAPAALINVAALSLSGSNFFLSASESYAGTFGMANGGTLELGANNLTLTAAAALGDVYVDGTGTLIVTGQADVSGMVLEGATSLVDTGTIVQDAGFSIGRSGTDTDGLTVNAGAVYDIINDNGIGAAGAGSIINAGLFEKTADNGNSYIYAGFTNAATGTIDVVSGQLILYNSASLNGTIEGAGVLTLLNDNNTVSLGAAAVLTVATFDVNNTLLLQGSRAYAGDFIDTNTVELNGFNLTLTGTAALDAYVQGHGTLSVTNGDISGLYEYNNLAVIDKGTLTQDGGYTIGNTATDSSSLSIVSGAVFDILTDNAVSANGTASAINNAGLFEKTGDYGTSLIYAGFTNSGTGTIDALRGFLEFQDGGTFNGTLAGGVDGTIADGGIIFDGGLDKLGSTVVIKAAELALANGTLALGANLNYTGYFDGTGGSLALGGHAITVASPYLGGFYLAGAGTMNVSGTGTLNGLGQINGSVLIDKGTIIQDGGYQLGYSATDASVLSISSTGVFDIVTDNYIGASGTAATVLNSGIFEKSADNGVSGIQPSFTNQAAGIIDVTHGDLVFSGGGLLGGTLEGAGEIQLNSGLTLTSSVVTVGTLDISAYPTLGTNLTYGGDFVLNYDDTLTLSSHALVLNGTASLIGAFEGPGTVTVNGHANVQLADLFGGATLIDNGYINQTDELRFSLNDLSSDSLSITSAGTYNIQDDSNFHSFGNATVTESTSNAGLLEKTGDTGLSELQVTLTNTGTVLVTSGTLQVDAVTNLAGGTLTGGTWIADTGFLGPILSLAGGTIAVDAAAITLSGAYSELIAGGTLIEQSLTSVSSSGVLAVDGGRNYTAPSAIADSGRIILQGGTFAAPSLSIAAGGSFAGYGTLAAPVLDNGRIEVTGSALTITGAVSGTGGLLIDAHDALILGGAAASGTNITFGGTHSALGLDAPGSVLSTLVSLAASDTIDLVGTLVKSATITGNVLAVSLTAGGIIDYTLANPAANIRAAVVSDGHGGSDIAIFHQAAASAIAPTPVNLGEHHTGSTVSQTYTIANTATVDPYSENLNASMGATSGGITDSGSFTGLAPGATNSTSLHASLVTSTGGVVNGTATVNLYTTGTGVNGDDGGTMALPSQTVALTGTIFNYATAAVTPQPDNLGQHHVGDVVSGFITIANKAAAGIYSENLDATFSGTSTDVTDSGSVTGLAAGGSSSNALAITLASGISGVESGHATIKLTSDGGGIDTLGNTGLTAQTVTVSGTLFNYATASAPGTIDFGIVHVGQTVSQYLTISNSAATGKYSENLDAKFSGTSGPLTTSGTLSELAAGTKSKTNLKLKFDSNTTGTVTGAVTLALTSDGKNIDSLGTTSLGGEVVNVIGTVNNYATTALEALSGTGTLSGSGTTLHLNLGKTTVGSAALNENLGVLNGATGPADLLAGSFSLSGSSAFTNGGLTGFSSLSAGGTADTAPTISLGTGTIGTFKETIVVHGTGSNASGYAGAIGNETIIVMGTITAAPMAFIAAATPTDTPAATPVTGSTAVKSFAALQAAPIEISSKTVTIDDNPAVAATTMALSGHTTTDLFKPPSDASHALVLAGLG